MDRDLKRKNQIRTDRGDVANVRRIDLFGTATDKVIKTDAGFLRMPIRATRVGVFKYLMPDGSVRRELRHPEEVFDEASMKTLAAVPITVKHPGDLVTSRNVGSLSVGMTGDSVEIGDETFLDVSGTITKDNAVQMVERKMKSNLDQEVSCGYKADIINESGIFRGERYDVRQVNIRYNHVALVDRGRAGNNVKLRLDDDQAITYDKNINVLEEKMKTIKIDGKEFEVEENLAAAVEKLDGKMKSYDEMTKKKKELEDELASVKSDMEKMKKSSDQMEAKKDSLEDKIKELEKANRVDHNEIDRLAEVRSDLCDVASKLIKEFKKDGKSNLEIKKEVIATINKDLKLDEKSEDYIDARFDSIAEDVDRFSDKLADGINKGEQNAHKKDGEETKFDSEAARAKFVKAQNEAWKKPLNERK